MEGGLARLVLRQLSRHVVNLSPTKSCTQRNLPRLHLSSRTLSTNPKLLNKSASLPKGDTQLQENMATAPVPTPGETEVEDTSLEPHREYLPTLQITNKPFIKNLFIGTFDTDMLTFPEVTNNQELADMNEFMKPYEDLFAHAATLDFARKKELPLDFITAMADVGLFAQAIPKEYGGMGLNNTYQTRMADVTGTIPMAHNLIEVHHNIATKMLVDNGTEEQKKKYLPKLATGEMIATLCLHETKGHLDFQSIKTGANVFEDADIDDDGVTLSGSKTWVPNANIADLFLVVANAPFGPTGQKISEGMSVFIVESTKAGVEVLDRIEEVESPRGLPLYDVSFANVLLKKSDMLGTGGEGDLTTINTMTSCSHHVAAANASLLKKFTNMVLYFLTKERVNDVPLYENQAYQAILADLQVTAYVMESMGYMTGQILDEFQQPDLTLEQAATRIWCVEAMQESLSSATEVFGIGSLENTHPVMTAFLDTLALKNFPIPMDLLKQYIALSGLRYGAAEKDEITRSMRDSLNHPHKIIKRIFRDFDDVQRVNTLHAYLHPVLEQASRKVEDMVFKFEKAVENYFVRGPVSGSILDDHLELNRMAWIVTQLYAMTCTMARASRSICIGVRYNDHEGIMAQHFIKQLSPRVEREIEILHHSVVPEFYRQMAKDIVEAKEYMPRHPLTRTY